MENIQKISGKCPENIQNISGKCLKSVWKVSENCLENIWKMCGKCFGNALTMHWNMLKNMLSKIFTKVLENVWKALGAGKKPHSSEQTTIDFAFASLVAEEKIDIGEVLTSKNVWAKRPNTGISVSKYNEIISNYYADVVIEKNEQITFSKIKKL